MLRDMYHETLWTGAVIIGFFNIYVFYDNETAVKYSPDFFVLDLLDYFMSSFTPST